MTNGAAPPAPLSLRELLRLYPHRERVTGWDPSNPPDVERAFRVGFRIGAERCAACDLEQAADFVDRMNSHRNSLYDPKHRWTDRKAAIFRGAMQGGLEAVRARAQGVKSSLDAWLKDLRAWADENPIRLEWRSAKPPDPPEPDGQPLGRDGVPPRLWGEVYGMWAGMAPLGWLPGEPKPKDSPAPPPPMKTPTAPTEQRLPNPFAATPVTVVLSDVQPESVRWLWPGRIALGKLTLLCGDPGLGKSFVTLDLAARVSSGTSWPDIPILPHPPGGVVLLSAEDDLADTIRPRLDAAGADPSRVVAIQAVRRILVPASPRGDNFDLVREDYFDLTEDLPALETAIEKTADCRLVIIDPLTAYLGKTDSHKNAEVRAVLAKLFDLAAKRKVAVLAVTHLNKAGGLPAIYRAMGSLAFVAAARAVWAVVRDENDETGRRRLFVPVKNNVGADESGLAYALEPVDGVARVAWEAAPVDMRADEALGGRQTSAVRDEARQFVVDTLTANGGDMLSDELTEAAKAEGIGERTFRSARKAVAVVYKEKVKGGQWRCRLREQQP